MLAKYWHLLKIKNPNRLLSKQLGFCMVRLIGLEPTRSEPLDPKSSASTNFATSAFVAAKIQLIFQLKEEKYKKL